MFCSCLVFFVFYSPASFTIIVQCTLQTKTAWSVKNSSVLTINQKSEKNILTLCIFDDNDEQDIGVKRSDDGQRYYRVTVYMQKHKTASTNERVTLVIYNTTNPTEININAHMHRSTQN